MIKEFITLRLKQLYRNIKGSGLISILFLIGLLGSASIYMFLQTSKRPNVFYVSVIYLSIIILIHLKRLDIKFLKTHFDNYKLILITEYVILTTPIFICLLINYQWIISTTLLLSIVFLANTNIKRKHHSLNTKIQDLIPDRCFEWKSGVRKTFFTILTLWIIGISTSFFFGSVPVVLFILGFIPISFYEESEPIQMLLAFETNPKKLIFNKIKVQILLFSILTTPLILAFIIFHYERWYIPIIEYFIFISLHIFIILIKYTFFEPNTKSGSAQFIGAIGAISPIVPIFIPVLWLMSVHYYFKAEQNLKTYLDDYN